MLSISAWRVLPSLFEELIQELREANEKRQKALRDKADKDWEEMPKIFVHSYGETERKSA